MEKAVSVALLVILIASAILSEAQQVAIIGFVTDVEGKPLPDAIVEVYRERSFIGASRTLPNGYFSLTLPGTGTYEIVVYKLGYERRSLRFDLLTVGTTNLGRIVLGYALSVSLATTYVVVDQGSVEELPLTVTNAGAFTILANVTVDAPPEWSVTLLTEQGLTVRNLILSPGDTRSLRIRIRVPARAEGVNTLALLFSYANVTQKALLTVESRYKDWEIIVPFYSEVTSFAGARLSVPVRIRNALEQSCVVNVSLVTPRGWLATIAINGTQVSSIRLSPGETVVAHLTVTLPEAAEPGSYVIVLQARALDILSRSTLIVRLEPSYDQLRVEAQSQYLVARPGDRVSIPLRVVNDGTRASVVSFAVEGLPAGYSWIVKDEYGNVLSAVVIPPKESRNILLTVDVPPAASPTAATFAFRAIGTNSSSKVELGLTVTGKPSINVLTQNWEAEVAPGSSVVFQLAIENNGQIPLREVSVSLGNVPSGLRVSVEPPRVLGLPPGGEALFALTIVADQGMEPGRYLIPLLINAEGVRVEERILAVNVRTGGGIFYTALSVLVLVLALLAYLLTIRRPRGALS